MTVLLTPTAMSSTAMSNNQLALSRVTRGQQGSLSRSARQQVPPFLQKLYEMVSDSSTDDLIRWSDLGDTFFVLDHERVAHDVLPRWFKHNNFASFVRQLNMYGFHKIPHLQQGVLKSDINTEIWNFEHPNFRRNQPDLLCLITRKKQAQDRPNDEATTSIGDGIPAGLAAAGLSPSAMVDINSIITGIQAIKRHQATISSDLNDLKASNQHLWQEALEARERHQKQQDTINRILRFLAGVFGTTATANKGPAHASPPSGIPRKRQRLMIESGNTEKERPLTPLDGVDSPVDGGTPTNRFVEMPQAPSSISEPRASPQPPEATTPTSDMFMNSTFLNQSTESPFSAYPSGPPLPTTQYPHQDPSDSSTALTSMQSYSPKQEVLQKIANSPGALERLMLLLQQQQEAPMPPPLDLNAPASEGPNAMSSNNDSDSAPFSSNSGIPQIPMDAALMMSNSHQLPQPFLPTVPQTTINALADSVNNLQQTENSAAGISDNIDEMQSNIDSLIQKLGMDPQEFSNSMHVDQSMDGHPGFMDNPDGLPDMLTGGISDNDPISNFDFSAFMNDYTQDNSFNANMNAGDPPDSASEATEQDGTTSPQLSAFVDEIASQSDRSSSPSLARTNLHDDVIAEAIERPQDDGVRKHRKRRSEVDSGSVERTEPTAKKRR